MTQENDQSAVMPPPDKFHVEVAYVINIVGTWDGRDEPMVFGLEFPETLGEVKFGAAEILTGAPMLMELTSPKALRAGLEGAVGMGVKLAGCLIKGDLSLEELMERASYASSNGVELDHEERVARLREIVDEVGIIKRAQAH